MKLIRKLFIVLICCLIIGGVFFVYDRLTDGFSIFQIKSSLPYYPQFDIGPLADDEKDKIEKILRHPFYYIGKGCQFYVFESEDGKTVIKLLKQKHLRTFPWAKKFPQFLVSPLEGKIKERETRVENLFSSCKLAYEELKKESGLIFIHLNRKAVLGKKVTLVDKLGLKHSVAIDDYEFVLQKKAISVQKVFENSAPMDIPRKIQNLMELVSTRCQKGICDRDRSFVQNVAFSEDGESAVFVDIGQFYKDPSILNEEEQKKDLVKRASNLLDWTQRKFPEFSPFVEPFVFQSIQ